MKKLFLVVLCAGLFVACGNKNQKTEEVADTVVVEEVAEPAPEEEAVVAEEAPVQEAAPAPAPAKKTTTKKQTVKEHAESAAENVANTAIDQAEKAATQSVVNTGKKRR